MTLQELLNSDVDLASLTALARQGLAWWLDELTAMLPAAWRERISARPRTWIEPRAAGGWRVWRDGRPTEAVATAGSKARIGLLAPPGAFLLREVPVPRMPAADVRRMLSLDIDRLSPLAPALIHYDIDILERESGDGRQRVLLGILPRAEAARMVAQARADGFDPVALAGRPDADGDQPRFDFLPQVRQAAGESSGARARLYWWAAVAGLILVNLAVLIGRDIIDVTRVQAAVDGQRPVVDAVLRLRRRVESEDARRRDLVTRGLHGDPLRVLDVLAQAIPTGAWVQHLEWNGQALRIIGFRRDDVDMVAAVRGSGAFTNPRSLTPESSSAANPLKPFDITADARPDRRP